MTDNSQSDPSYDWTTEEIEARLGSSTVVFPRDRLLQAQDIEKLRNVGITRIEVSANGNPAHLDFDDRKYLSWDHRQYLQQQRLYVPLSLFLLVLQSFFLHYPTRHLS